MEDLKKLIPSAKEVRCKTYKNDACLKQLRKEIEKQNNKIETAREKGLFKTCFIVSCEYENVLKKMYEEQGYEFEPTGYVGGHWQRTEDICW